MPNANRVSICMHRVIFCGATAQFRARKPVLPRS